MGVNGETDDTSSSIDKCGKRFVKPPMFQKGVLRTNCIDCLDRTNVAQFAFGLVSLGHQLHALGFTDDPIIGMDCPLADDIMRLYETMCDTLALQYGGSAAHNKSKIKLPVNSGKKKSGLSAEKPFLLAYEEAYC